MSILLTTKFSSFRIVLTHCSCSIYIFVESVNQHQRRPACRDIPRSLPFIRNLSGRRGLSPERSTLPCRLAQSVFTFSQSCSLWFISLTAKTEEEAFLQILIFLPHFISTKNSLSSPREKIICFQNSSLHCLLRNIFQQNISPSSWTHFKKFDTVIAP
jgi:hypothetical protein